MLPMVLAIVPPRANPPPIVATAVDILTKGLFGRSKSLSPPLGSGCFPRGVDRFFFTGVSRTGFGLTVIPSILYTL